VQNGKAVVVVVQDLFFAVRLSDALRSLGYKGLTVQDECELLPTMAEARPQLIILDLQGHIKPQTVVRAARESVPGRAIPVLAYGLHTDLKRRDEALQAGVRRVVSKSLIASELPQLVKSILRV
jgi:CheY-like chemotaxis protein